MTSDEGNGRRTSRSVTTGPALPRKPEGARRAHRGPDDPARIRVERPGAAVIANEVDDTRIHRGRRRRGCLEALFPAHRPGGRIKRRDPPGGGGGVDPVPVGREPAAGDVVIPVGLGREASGPEERSRRGDGGHGGPAVEREDPAARDHRIGGDPVPFALALADPNRPGKARRGGKLGVNRPVSRTACAVAPVGVAGDGRGREGHVAGGRCGGLRRGPQIETFARERPFTLSAPCHQEAQRQRACEFHRTSHHNRPRPSRTVPMQHAQLSDVSRDPPSATIICEAR